jgi:hypothetical protein
MPGVADGAAPAGVPQFGQNRPSNAVPQRGQTIGAPSKPLRAT